MAKFGVTPCFVFENNIFSSGHRHTDFFPWLLEQLWYFKVITFVIGRKSIPCQICTKTDEKGWKKIHQKMIGLHFSMCEKKVCWSIWRNKYFYLSPCGGEASLSACEILLEDNNILRGKCVWFTTKFLAGDGLLVIGWLVFCTHVLRDFQFSVWHWWTYG